MVSCVVVVKEVLATPRITAVTTANMAGAGAARAPIVLFCPPNVRDTSEDAISHEVIGYAHATPIIITTSTTAAAAVAAAAVVVAAAAITRCSPHDALFPVPHDSKC